MLVNVNSVGFMMMCFRDVDVHLFNLSTVHCISIAVFM